MSAPVNPADPPMAEPGKRPTGAAAGAPRNEPASRGGKKRDAGTSASIGAKVEASPTGTPATQADDEDEWRHEPVAPVDESNPLRSLGKAVGDTVTGSGPDTPAPSKR
jgi:hypothetical protein